MCTVCRYNYGQDSGNIMLIVFLCTFLIVIEITKNEVVTYDWKM